LHATHTAVTVLLLHTTTAPCSTAQVTLKYIKPGVALPDFYEVKTTSTQASPMIVMPLGQPAGTDPKGVLFNDVNAPSCTTPLTAVLGTQATPKFGIVTLNVSGMMFGVQARCATLAAGTFDCHIGEMYSWHVHCIHITLSMYLLNVCSVHAHRYAVLCVCLVR
jgi:hypothetical protein